MKESDYTEMMERKMNLYRRLANGMVKMQTELMDALNTTDPAPASGAASGDSVAVETPTARLVITHRPRLVIANR